MNNNLYGSYQIEAIYLAIIKSNVHSVAITSSHEKEGVSTLANAIAQRSAIGGKSTLLVDFSLHNPSFHGVLDIDKDKDKDDHKDDPLLTPKLVTFQHDIPVVLGVTAPKELPAITKLREPGAIEKYIERWRLEYELIIIDTSPVQQKSPHCIRPERISASADGCIFVVLSGKTNEAIVKSSLNTLTEGEANIIGSVLNDRDHPNLADEMLREAKRLKRLSPRLVKWLEMKIRHSKLLSLEV